MIIKINNIILEGIHGFTEKEKLTPQRFRVDVEVKLPQETRVADNIERTFDYRKIKKIITDTIKGEPRLLIETLGEEIADKIIENGEIISVEVTVSKLDIWDNGFPSVTIIRKR